MPILSVITSAVSILGLTSALVLLAHSAGGQERVFAVAVAAAFSGLLFVGLSKIKIKPVIEVNALACLAILYAAQALLVGIPSHRSKLVEVHRLRREGVHAYPASYPWMFYAGESRLLDLDGRKILPLSGLALVPTVYCQEADPFLTYHSDRHGFNNPDGTWDTAVDVGLLGDSFTHGACVPSGDHFVAALRQRFGVLNLGVGGNGPLTELAALREYLTRVRPKTVFWLYAATNDVVRRPHEKLRSDLQLELEGNAVLQQYLKTPGFNQDLVGLQNRLGPVYRAALDAELQQQDAEAARLGSLWSWWGQAAQWITLRPLVAFVATVTDIRRALRGTDPVSDADATRLLETFGQILEQAKKEVAVWGGRLVFVYLPDHQDVLGTPHRLREDVLRVARANGLPVIDLLDKFSGLEDKLSLFAYGSAGGHYSGTGYGVLGTALLDWIENTDPTR